jgi:hypothetical protein
MRASLLHPISRRRQARRPRGGHRPSPTHAPYAEELRTDVATRGTGVMVQGTDVAAQRVRSAGGPTDLASYACQCGYLFTAAVTTSVGCPHCGAPQAW